MQPPRRKSEPLRPTQDTPRSGSFHQPLKYGYETSPKPHQCKVMKKGEWLTVNG